MREQVKIANKTKECRSGEQAQIIVQKVSKVMSSISNILHKIARLQWTHNSINKIYDASQHNSLPKNTPRVRTNKSSFRCTSSHKML